MIDDLTLCPTSGWQFSKNISFRTKNKWLKSSVQNPFFTLSNYVQGIEPHIFLLKQDILLQNCPKKICANNMKNFFDFSFSAFMGVMSTLPYCLPFTEDVTGSFRYVLSTAQCGNLAIFLPLRFCVKSILDDCKNENFVNF